MALYPWEEQAYHELTKLYNDFFDRLSELGKKCFRIDSHELFCDNVKQLSEDQKQAIINYWKKYIDDLDLNYHQYYIDRTGKFDVRFIPDDIFAGYIDGYLNNRSIEAGISDKNYFDLYLAGFNMPKTIVHLINGYYETPSYEIISKEDAICRLLKSKSFIAKPSMASYGGKGVELFENPSVDDINSYIEQNGDNIIFQEIVKQHPMTGLLHPQSINTIRIMTLVLDNDIKILPAAFRMGVGSSSVDNASKGGIYCKISPDGRLSDFAYDALGNRYDSHPDGGKFNQVEFDFMPKVEDLVKNAAQRFLHFRLIGWDIAIDQDANPIIIEANLTMSGMDVIETICGPLFGDYTEQILDEIFILNKKKKNLSMDILQYI